MLRVCAVGVKPAENCEPCTEPVANEDCCRASATVVNPRALMSAAVMVVIGVAVSISVCGISEPVTVTASSFLALVLSGVGWLPSSADCVVSCCTPDVPACPVASCASRPCANAAHGPKLNATSTAAASLVLSMDFPPRVIFERRPPGATGLPLRPRLAWPGTAARSGRYLAGRGGSLAAFFTSRTVGADTCQQWAGGSNPLIPRATPRSVVVERPGNSQRTPLSPS